jgi:hypothetical protein
MRLVYERRAGGTDIEVERKVMHHRKQLAPRKPLWASKRKYESVNSSEMCAKGRAFDLNNRPSNSTGNRRDVTLECGRHGQWEAHHRTVDNREICEGREISSKLMLDRESTQI